MSPILDFNPKESCIRMQIRTLNSFVVNKSDVSEKGKVRLVPTSNLCS